jgi:phospholipase C
MTARPVPNQPSRLERLPVTETNSSGGFSRRALLGGLAAAVGGTAAAMALPETVRAAISASRKAGPFDLSKVKHVVIAMQENRSFDHYFGTIYGVRGFGDRTVEPLPNGRPRWFQTDASNPDGFLLPYRLNTKITAAEAIPSMSHAWSIQHAAWNFGQMDNWLQAHMAADGPSTGPYTMGYFERADLPFQYALADAFTICDNYFCSMMGPTHPNRLMLMTGTIDPNGVAGGPALDNNGNNVGGNYTWTTYAERLQAAGVTWKVYQQADNYGCNALEYMEAFNVAPPTSPLAIYGTGVSTLYSGQPAANPALAFEEDAKAGNLPTVSWIIPTSTDSEHPSYLPAAGASFIASKIEAIASNPEMWESTVFILTYDENDGLFDHVTPITPPPGTPDEYVTLEATSTYTPGSDLPIGSGFRVPCLIVSPWTTGGYVYSGASEHTSVLRFLEQVTGVTEPNISAWRRQTFGDLTDAFQSPATVPSPPSLPGTAATLAEAEYAVSHYPLPAFPMEKQQLPVQEPGRRPRVGPVPYWV